MHHEPERDTSFGSGRPLSLGVQEELFLVDPVTGVQVNTGRAALARAPENAGTLKRELSQLLRAPRHVNQPPGVAKVASQLAEDRRHGKRAEADPAVGIEAVDRSQPADRRHLHEVLARLAGAGIAAGQLAGKGQEALEQLIPPLTRVPTQTDATESVISRAPRTAVQAMFGLARPSAGISVGIHRHRSEREENLR